MTKKRTVRISLTSIGCLCLIFAIPLVLIFLCNPLFNPLNYFRAPNFQTHDWKTFTIEYYVLSDSDLNRLNTEKGRLNDSDLRQKKYLTIDSPDVIQEGIKLIEIKDWWGMSIGVQKGTNLTDADDNIWDMTIHPLNIYIANRNTKASYGFKLSNNDFAKWVRNLAFENELKTNPDSKIENIGLWLFPIYYFK